MERNCGSVESWCLESSSWKRPQSAQHSGPEDFSSHSLGLDGVAAGSTPGNASLSLSGGFCYVSSRPGAVQGTELEIKSDVIPV